MDFFIDGTETIILEQKAIEREMAPFIINDIIRPSIVIQPFKEQSGLPIMEKYQRDMSFITKMETEETTTSKILSVLKNLIIKKSTCLIQILGHSQMRVSSSLGVLTLKPKNGMQVQKGLSGTENMHKIHCHHAKEQNIPKYVLFAQKNSWENRLGKNIVVPIAKPKEESFGKKITKIALVVYVKLYSLVINTFLRRHVVKSVQLHQWSEPRKVYDLTVEQDNCYYANGYLVSNCDATRYLCQSLNHVHQGISGTDYTNLREVALRSGNKPNLSNTPFTDNPWRR